MAASRRIWILLIIVLLVGMFALTRKTTRYTETIDVCETEEPEFNAADACQKIVDSKYDGRQCTFEFGPRKDLPLGSCTPCMIICR